MRCHKIFAQVLFLVLVPVVVFAGGPLTISYFERPPYYYTSQAGKPSGLLVERSREILEETGVVSQYLSLPPNQILYILRHAKTPHCSIGWFKTAERELYAKFSEPIYRDQPLVLLTQKKQQQKFANLKTLRQVFSSTHLIMARMGEFSYGNYVDTLIGELVPKSIFFTGKQEALLQAVADGRATYMLVAPEEVSTLVNSSKLSGKDFFTLRFADVPAGTLRYLMCNLQVDEETINLVNATIRKHYPGLGKEIQAEVEK